MVDFAGPLTHGEQDFSIIISGAEAITNNLSITPLEPFRVTAPEGGPYLPASNSYTLTNNGSSPLNWTANDNVNWLSLSSNSGTIAPGASATVVASFNAGANVLVDALHTGLITFTDSGTGYQFTHLQPRRLLTGPISMELPSAVTAQTGIQS